MSQTPHLYGREPRCQRLELSERETLVLRLVDEGKTHKQIAAALGCALATVPSILLRARTVLADRRVAGVGVVANGK